jgi:tRNA pseudouridine55 synthase
MHGVLVVDKPIGPTSHDMVDRVRRLLGERRVGHTGTLDPFASGVLPICVGKATRLARFFTGHDKTYRAVVRLGFATTTDDVKGDPIGAPQPVAVEREAVVAVSRSLVGEIQQVPPAFSAKRSAGRRDYERARAGEVVERRAFTVTVHAFDVLGVEGDRVEINVSCGAGTYVRALARDLGERLGTGGHLVALRRTRSGSFGLEDAVALDGLDRAGAEARLLPLGRVLPELPAVHVAEEGLRALRHGRDLGRSLVVAGFPDPAPERVRVLDPTGGLVALAVPRGFGPAVPGLPVEPVLHPDLVLID